MRLFGRGKKSGRDEKHDDEATDDKGLVWLFRELSEKAENEYAEFVLAHLRRIHEPGGYEREKREISDFIDLGMGRTYLQAVDDVRFSPEETIVMAEVRGPRGRCDVVTRWTVTGVHARPLAGVEPAGEEITIEGATISTIRDYRLRSDFSYWQIPELTRKVLGS
jgi:hypothetical protein